MAVTEFGTRIQRFPEILDEIEEQQRQLIDPAINNRDDEFLSENNMIVAEQVGKCKEFLEAIKDNWDIAKAEGFALDALLQLKKIYRIGASRSYTNSQYFYGTPGVTIPANTVLLSSATSDTFFTTQALTLTASNSISSIFRITSVTDETLYTVVINGKVYSYLSGIDSTREEIYDGIEELFLADPPSMGVVAFSNSEEDQISVLGDGSIFSNVQVSSNITATQIVSKVRVEASVVGSIIAPLGTVNKLRVPITGVTLVNNPQPYIVGRLRETDEAFRLRGISSVSSDGTATIPAITGSLFNNVPGVSSVFIVENDTHITDPDNRPPHSYETVVTGGDDQLIGEDMWRTKPSGIQTYGNTSVFVRDSNDILRMIRFTRPQPRLIAVKVDYSLYDEESFPVNGTAMIREAVSRHVNNLGIGKDVIVGRISAAIYNYLASQGLDEVIVSIQTITSTGEIPDPTEWTDDRLPISDTEYAATTFPDIYITEV